MPLPAAWFLVFGYLLSMFGSALSADTLSDDDLGNIPSPGDDFDIHDGKLLAPILIPRVPGTEGSLKAQQHFSDFFKNELPDWEAIVHRASMKTPISGDGETPFVNYIFRRDPPWAQEGEVSRLTLVAHYDSLIKPEGFIGATDSAAPCAMLMHVARSIDKALTSKWQAMQDNGEDGLEEDKGVQIIFLDGEEAFEHWTDTDSVYGARALAEEWETQSYGTMSTHKTPLQSISLFVLLDLLGWTDPQIPSYFLPTHWAYRNMAKIEGRMRKLELLEAKPPKPYFPESEKAAVKFNKPYIGDDHVPFMQRGVDILHLIPQSPWKNWHTMDDDGEHLDLPTCRDWAKIVTAFTVEWMELADHMPQLATTRLKQERSETENPTSKRTEL